MIIITAVSLANIKRFGIKETGSEITELLCLVLIVYLCQQWISESKYYRKAAHGAVAGCLASPAVISAFQVQYGRIGLSSIYLRLSLGCTLLTIVEAVHGNGGWRITSRPVLQRAAMCFGIVIATFVARFPSLSFWIPTGVLLVHHVVHRAFLRALPETFTLGEATLVTTATSLLLVDTAAMLCAGCLGLAPRACQAEPCFKAAPVV